MWHSGNTTSWAKHEMIEQLLAGVQIMLRLGYEVVILFIY